MAAPSVCLQLRWWRGGGWWWSPAPCGGCCLNICRAQALVTARILRIGLRTSCLTQVGPAFQIPCPLLVTAVCTAPRRALCPPLFVCLGEAPDISLLFYSPLTLRSTAAPWGPRLRLSSDPSLPVTKGCLREQALGWQPSPLPGMLAAALRVLGMDRVWLCTLAQDSSRLVGSYSCEPAACVALCWLVMGLRQCHGQHRGFGLG